MNHTISNSAMTVFLVGALLLVPAGLAVSQQAAQTLDEPVQVTDLEDVPLDGATAGLPVEPAPLMAPAGDQAAGKGSWVHFEPNLGQSPGDVEFIARTTGYTLFLTQEEAVFVLPGDPLEAEKAEDPEGLQKGAPSLRGADRVVRMGFDGAMTDPVFTPRGERSGVSNYFLGNDPSGWTTQVPHHDEVLVTGLWPGIDMLFLATPEGAVRFDFLVQPGADPSDIRLGFEGADPLLDEGDLVLQRGQDDLLRFPAPFTYQESGEGVEEIESGFIITAGDSVGFHLGEYDPTNLLVVDPVALDYSTYLGGSEHDRPEDVKVDEEGHAHVVGLTLSTDYPIKDAFQDTFTGQAMASLTKLTPDGSDIVFSTFLGGDGFDRGFGLELADSGEILVTGQTNSTDFPTQNAFQGTHPAPSCSSTACWTAFVTKLDPSGGTLLFSTYLGGSNSDTGNDITTDSAGNAYVVGHTWSNDFPTINAFQDTRNGAPAGFVTKFNTTGTVVFSTYLAGGSRTLARGVQVDDLGSAYVVGYTHGGSFPTLNAFQDTHLNPGVATAFVTRFHPDGDSILYSTYLGGTELDLGIAIAIDGDGHAYVTGDTESTDFPQAEPLFDSHPSPGERSAYVTKFDPSGSSLVYSTFLGGSDQDTGRDLAVDAEGRVYITGSTESTDFPVVQAFQDVFPACCQSVPYVTKLAATGKTIEYSTYLGGSFSPHLVGGLDLHDDAVYVTGSTSADDFPTTPGAYQESIPSTSRIGFVSNLVLTGCVTPGPDGYGYICRDEGPSFGDISGSGTSIGLGDEEISAPLEITQGGTLGPFLYYGKPYTSVVISSNGFITLGSASGTACCNGKALPDPSLPDTMIAGHWTDLDPSSGGTIHTAFTTRGGNDVFIVQFTDVPLAGSSTRTATFQILLDYVTNEVHVVYGQVAGSSFHNASTGIEDHDGQRGLTYKNGTSHSPGNGVMDNGDGIYLNLDAGSGLELVEVLDVRLVATGETAGALVAPVDTDLSRGIEMGPSTTVCFFDADGTSDWTAGDPMYLMNNRDFCDTVQNGDFRLTVSGTNNPATFVEQDDSDRGVAALDVGGTRLMYVDVSSNGEFGGGDWVYLMTSGDDAQLSTGDLRLTDTSGGDAFTPVFAGDADATSFVPHAFVPDVRIDDPDVVAYYDSQKRTVRFIPPAPSPPSHPLNLASVQDDFNLTLFWDPPEDNGMSHLTQYVILAGPSEAELAPVDLVTAEDTNYFAALPEDDTFYAVQAENEEGVGPQSDVILVVVPDPPGPITGLAASAGPNADEITVTWNPPEDDGGATVESYHVYASDMSGGPYSLLATVDASQTSFTEAGLGPDTTRCYIVSAENSAGEGPTSGGEVCEPTFDLPDPPQAVSASAIDKGTLLVEWDPPLDDGGRPVTEYLVYGADAPGGPYALLGTVDSSVDILDFQESDLADDVERCYVVTSQTDVGESDQSDESCATTWAVPGAPQELTATPGPGAGEMTLEWQPPLDDGGDAVDSYHVYVGDSSESPFELLATLEGSQTSFTLEHLDPDVTLCFVVSAENGAGEGPQSEESCTQTFDTPGAPQTFDATTGPVPGSILLDWSAPESDGGLLVTQYNVYAGDDPGGPFQLLASVDPSTLSFSETGLGDAVERFYHVSAVNDAGEGDPTQTRGSTTQPAEDPSPLPAGRSATAAFWQGHYAYVIAGRDAEGNATDTIQRFDPVENEAVLLNVTLPSPRLGVSAVWGPGVDDPPEGEEMETQSCHPSCPVGRGFIFGGLGDNFEDQSASPQSCHPSCPVEEQILIFDPEEDDVKSSDAHFSQGRFGTSAVFATFVDDQAEESGVGPSSCHPSCPVETIYIFGGFGVEFQFSAENVYPESCHPSCPVGKQIIEYDPLEDAVEQHDATLPEPLGGTSAVWDPEAQVAYIFGGRSDVGAQAGSASCDPGCSAAILRFDPVAGQVDVMPVELPSQRWNTSAVFDGRHAYVIGGENETGLINEIVRFDPENMTVEVVSSLPTKRTQTSAVFDGKDAYIFGGLEEDNEATDEIVRYTPGAPQQTQAEAGPGVGEVTVTWGPPPEDGGTPIEAYRVYRSVEGGLWERIAVLAPLDPTFVDTGLENGTMVSYRVSAVNDAGEGPQGDPGSVRTFDLPGAPQSLLSAPGPGVGELRLSWEPPEDDGGAAVFEYVVYRADALGGPFVPIGVNETGSLTFTDSGLDPLDVRYYQVAAKNLVGDGPVSGVVEGRTFDPFNIYVIPDGPITIQQAAQMVAEGGTIYLAPGVYPEEVELLTDNVTIQEGVSDGSGPLSVASGTSHAPVIQGGIKVSGATSFAMRDVQVNATKGGFLKGVALSTDGVSTMEIVNATFRGEGESKGPDFFPGLVDLRDVETLVFTGSTIEGDSAVPGSPSGLRVQYAGHEVSVLIAGNGISGVKGAGVALTGVEAEAHIEVIGNGLIENGDGVHVFNAVFGDLSITRNDVQDHDSVGVRFSGTLEGDPVLRYNAFTGNDVGVTNSGGLGAVDARHNWWGHVGGPLAGDQAAMLAVDYTPWCVQSSCGLDEDLVDPLLP